ncbi:transcription factor SPEECHLESS [Cinnamomum micranthum f. kanehirae]|uniref:Transcription factor SPEECHLESS n=1 Tax=Cinnamomum micranthum f. kanehirae TaxID=337451 RepID=A0A443PQX5_9MAGN|nr:transcription factor SPEECHLESS [Cinnamomum micranthum f. kanehirae]
MDDRLSDLFEEREFGDTNLAGADSPENLFDIFEALEDAFDLPCTPVEEAGFSPNTEKMPPLTSQKSSSSSAKHEAETDIEGPPANKKLKTSSTSSSEDAAPDGQQRASHIMVERNRRKQMNENLSILRSLMPSFYIKRADQASIIGGVVNFIKELQQVLRSLEEKKQRKVYSEVLSPRSVSSPRPLPLSPRPPSLSPRPPPLSPIIGLPISPRTPQPASPYNPRMQQLSLPSPKATFHEPPSFDNVKELAANSKSRVADVEVKFAGPNVLLKTTSPRIPGQALKIISTLEDLALEVLHVSISTVDETMLNSFTIKIGIECELSAEDLANEIQQTFF